MERGANEFAQGPRRGRRDGTAPGRLRHNTGGAHAAGAAGQRSWLASTPMPSWPKPGTDVGPYRSLTTPTARDRRGPGAPVPRRRAGGSRRAARPAGELHRRRHDRVEGTIGRDQDGVRVGVSWDLGDPGAVWSGLGRGDIETVTTVSLSIDLINHADNAVVWSGTRGHRRIHSRQDARSSRGVHRRRRIRSSCSFQSGGIRLSPPRARRTRAPILAGPSPRRWTMKIASCTQPQDPIAAAEEQRGSVAIVNWELARCLAGHVREAFGMLEARASPA